MLGSGDDFHSSQRGKKINHIIHFVPGEPPGIEAPLGNVSAPASSSPYHQPSVCAFAHLHYRELTTGRFCVVTHRTEANLNAWTARKEG